MYANNCSDQFHGFVQNRASWFTIFNVLCSFCSMCGSCVHACELWCLDCLKHLSKWMFNWNNFKVSSLICHSVVMEPTVPFFSERLKMAVEAITTIIWLVIIFGSYFSCEHQGVNSILKDLGFMRHGGKWTDIVYLIPISWLYCSCFMLWHHGMILAVIRRILWNTQWFVVLDTARFSVLCIIMWIEWMYNCILWVWLCGKKSNFWNIHSSIWYIVYGFLSWIKGPSSFLFHVHEKTCDNERRRKMCGVFAYMNYNLPRLKQYIYPRAAEDSKTVLPIWPCNLWWTTTSCVLPWREDCLFTLVSHVHLISCWLDAPSVMPFLLLFFVTQNLAPHFILIQ